MKYHELLKIVNPRRIKVAEMKAELKIVREISGGAAAPVAREIY